MKKNKGLMKILTIISILLVSLVVFSGCGKEKSAVLLPSGICERSAGTASVFHGIYSAKA